MTVFAVRRRIYLILVNIFRLPRRVASILVKRLGLLLSPRQARARRASGAWIADPSRAIPIPEDRGYVRFGPNDLPGVAELVRACRATFEEYRRSGKLDARPDEVGKRFLVQVTRSPLELMRQKAVQDFVLSDVVAATAQRYLSRIPLVAGVELFWSPANDTEVRSQKYHFDAEDYRQLKLFVNIEAVTPDCGPFTLVGSGRAADVCRKTGYIGGRGARLDDEAVDAELSPADVIQITGEAGSGVLCDTSRCLHYGSRRNSKDRLVLLVQLIDYFAPKLQPADWGPIVDDVAGRIRPPERLLLLGALPRR